MSSCHDRYKLRCTYPFLRSLPGGPSKLQLIQAASQQPLVSAASQIIYEFVSRGEFPLLCDAAEGRLSHYLAYGYVAVASSEPVVRRYIEWASQSAYLNMTREPVQCLRSLSQYLGVEARDPKHMFNHEPLVSLYYHVVRFVDYIRYMVPNDPDWAPINRPVISGWVFLKRGELPRLLKEAYKAAMWDIWQEMSNDPIFAGRLKALVPPEVAEALGRLKDRYSAVAQVRSTGPWPPCMAGLWDALRRGENLPHTARFALASFLLAVGWDVDRVVDAFRAVPDFDEKVTRYQVQHIAGQAGGRKRYSVPNCQTLNGWGLCPGPCGVRHPLQYMRRYARQAAPTNT